MRLRTLALLATLSLGAFGCARGPAVSADGLALRRVVIYRNGVGYFERAGHVEADKVEFRVRGEEVGDFLASLAVIEQGGSSVRAASFPLKVEKDEDADPPDDDEPPAPPTPPGVMPRPPEKKKPAEKKKKKLETVVLELDGKEHDLQVGYIAATPVWRPSYRLVIEKDGAELQSWGIVQNLSGEDWTAVSLSLIAGAPLAFEAKLGQPVIPERPVVTDSGEVIAAVPRSETSLNQEQPPPPPPAAPVAAPATGADKDEPSLDDLRDEAERKNAEAVAESGPGLGRFAGVTRGTGGAAAAAPKPSKKVAAYRPRPSSGPMGGAAPAPIQEPRPNPSAPRNLSALAAIAVEAGATRYDIPTPITVPDKSATMVMLLSKKVPGESIFLFAPDGGVPDSMSHPFRVARFTNKSGGLLERGPIAIFEQGAFLGQGMVDPLPDGATATVPFALERSLAVESERTFGEEGARLAKIESGTIMIERDAVTRTKYRVRNGGDKNAKILLKHARTYQTRLHEPPKGTEDNVGTGSALVPAEAAPHATAELVVDERQAVARSVDWLSQLADDAVKAYLADKRADAGVAAQLSKAWVVRETLVRAVEERQKLTDEQRELENATEETRRNLKALEKNKAAADLRQRLTDRLAKNALRLDEITKRLVELDMTINEQRVRFTDTIRSIKMLEPLKPSASS